MKYEKEIVDRLIDTRIERLNKAIKDGKHDTIMLQLIADAFKRLKKEIIDEHQNDKN